MQSNAILLHLPLFAYKTDMRRINYFLVTIMAVVLAACSGRKGYFTIEGRFLNMNQGELYVYSNDGLTSGIDTIKVNGGRFSLDIPCQRKGTLILVFPNFSEQPVFAEPGKSVDIKADASHLKQMTTTGTKDNELMSDFRQAIASASPPETVKTAETFIKDNPGTQVAIYLMNRYLICSGKPEYVKKAKELLPLIEEKQPKNGALVKMKRDISILLAGSVGSSLPDFRATATDGNTITAASLRGKTAIIFTWASWSYDSENMMRRINSILAASKGRVAAVGINVDASREECVKRMKSEGLTFPSVCDEQLFESKLLAALGMQTVPDNIIVGPDGRVIARSVATDDIERYLK